MNEQEILVKVASGDQRAFTLLVEQYLSVVYAHVLTYIKNAVQAEEITQDIFMNVWKYREKLSTIDNFPGYLYRMTRNRTISAFRVKLFNTEEPAQDELGSEELDPAETLEFRQFSDIVRKGIELLPPRRKQVFMMSRFEQMSYEQIAKKLNISQSSVNQHIVEALLFLRTYLRNQSLVILYLSILTGTLLK